MKSLKKILLIFFLFLTVFAVCAVFSACGKGDKESTVIIVSEETFNNSVKPNDGKKLEFSPSKLKKSDEDTLVDGKKYYALFYLYKESFAKGYIEIDGNVRVDESILVGGGDVRVSNEDYANVYDVVNNVKNDISVFYAAVGFTVCLDDTDEITYMSEVKAYFFYTEDEKAEDEDDYKNIHTAKKASFDKQLNSDLTVKYLSDDDYASGSLDGKLKDSITPAIGEKFYIVIDYDLSNISGIEETDTGEISVSFDPIDGTPFSFDVEEFPTADYNKSSDRINATFKIHGGDDGGKILRFIIAIRGESAGRIDVFVEFFADRITVDGAKRVLKRIQISETATVESKLTYALSGDGSYYTVTAIGGESGVKINVPASYNGLPVKAIAEGVFSGSNYLTEVTLSEGLERIDANAFRGCKSLTSIVIPSTVMTVGNNAFADCPNMDIFCVGKSKPSGWSDGFASKDAYVTWNYHNLFKPGNESYHFTYAGTGGTRVAVPSTYNGLPVTGISVKAFYGCAELRSVKLPDSITHIGTRAFSGCYALKSIVIPENVAYNGISDDAFLASGLIEVINRSECPIMKTSYGLNALEVHRGESKLVNKDGYLFYSVGEKNYLVGEAEGKATLTLPSDYNGQTFNIHREAFYKNNVIKSASLGDGVKMIDAYAFYGCENLSELTLGKNVSYISDSSFTSCTGLKSVTFNCISVSGNDNAFYNCGGVTALTLGDNVSSLNTALFSYFTALDQITVDKDNTAYKSVDNCLIDTENNMLILGCKNSVIPNDGSVTVIGPKAFKGCTGLTEITVPGSIIRIEQDAFSGCTGLKGVYTSDLAKWCEINFCSTASNPIYYAKKLYLSGETVTSLIIPNTVTSLGNAFSGCETLLSVTIPESIVSISSDAFKGCNKLVEVINKANFSVNVNDYGLNALEVHTEKSKVTENDGFYFYTVNGVSYLIDYRGISKEITLPSDFDGQGYKIHKYAFYGQKDITRLTVPDSVTEIGDYAFAECDSLETVSIGSGVSSIGDHAFYECNGLKTVLIAVGLTSIGDYAFGNCGLEAVKYGGTKNQWSAITKGDLWDLCYSDGYYVSSYSLSYNVSL